MMACAGLIRPDAVIFGTTAATHAPSRPRLLVAYLQKHGANITVKPCETGRLVQYTNGSEGSTNGIAVVDLVFLDLPCGSVKCFSVSLDVVDGPALELCVGRDLIEQLGM